MDPKKQPPPSDDESGPWFKGHAAQDAADTDSLTDRKLLQQSKHFAKSATDNALALRKELEQVAVDAKVASTQIQEQIAAAQPNFYQAILPWAVAGVLALFVGILLINGRNASRSDGELRTQVSQLSDDIKKRPAPAVDPTLGEKLDKLADLPKKVDDLAADKKSQPAAKFSQEQVQQLLNSALSDPKVQEAMRAGGPNGAALTPEKINNAVIAALISPEAQKKIVELYGTGGSNAKAIEEAVKAIKAEADKAAKAIETRYQAALDQQNKAAAADLAALRKEVERLAKLSGVGTDAAENLDVILVATDSQAFPAKQYADVFKKVLDRLPRDAEEKRYRLGFYAALGGRLEDRVPLVGGKPTPNSFAFQDPDPGTVEELPELGPQVLVRFDELRPNRRCILIASAASAPPKPGAAGWDKITPVHVVLVRHDGRPADGRSVAGWVEFCAARRGSLTVLAAPDLKTEPEALRDALTKQLLWLADPKTRR